VNDVKIDNLLPTLGLGASDLERLACVLGNSIPEGISQSRDPGIEFPTVYAGERMMQKIKLLAILVLVDCA